MESNKGNNKVFEDYGSNYGSYGDEENDPNYEDLVGDFDDDWQFEREPKEQKKPAAGAGKPKMEYQEKLADDPKHIFVDTKKSKKDGKDDHEEGKEAHNESVNLGKGAKLQGWDSRGGWDGRDQRKDIREKHHQQQEQYRDPRGPNYGQHYGYDNRNYYDQRSNRGGQGQYRGKKSYQFRYDVDERGDTGGENYVDYSTYRESRRHVTKRYGADGDSDNEEDDRDQYEDFELVTKKFIIALNEDTEYVLRNILKYRESTVSFYKADWYSEYSKGGADFIQDDDWRVHTQSMKGKYCCFKCKKKLANQQAKYGRGDPAIADGWTTGNCTVQFLFKDIPAQNKKGKDNEHSKYKENFETKCLVRAFSQYCKTCGKHGDIGTYIDEVDRLSYIFAQKVIKYYFPHYRVYRQPAMQRPSGPFGQSGQMRPAQGQYEEKLHLEELCSACKHGVCVYIMKAKKKKEREERQVEYEDKPRQKQDVRQRERGERPDRGAPRQGPPRQAGGDEYEHRGPPRQPPSRGQGGYRQGYGDQYRDDRGYQRGAREDPRRRDDYGYGGQERDDRGFRGGRGDPRGPRRDVRERDNYYENPERADPRPQRGPKQEENDDDYNQDEHRPAEEEKEAAFKISETTGEPEPQHDDDV